MHFHQRDESIKVDLSPVLGWVKINTICAYFFGAPCFFIPYGVHAALFRHFDHRNKGYAI